MSQLLFIQGNSKTVTEGEHWDSDRDQDMEETDSIAAALQHTDVSDVELYNDVWKSQTPPSGSRESLDPDDLTPRHPPYLHDPNSVCILWLHQSEALNFFCFYQPAQKEKSAFQHYSDHHCETELLERKIRYLIEAAYKFEK